MFFGVTMKEDTNDSAAVKLPPKPMGMVASILIFTAVGAAIGAGLAAVFTKIFPRLSEGKGLLHDVMEWAKDFAFIGILSGYFSGKFDQEKYELRVENAYTQRQLSREKSFTKTLLAERKAPTQESQTRQ